MYIFNVIDMQTAAYPYIKKEKMYIYLTNPISKLFWLEEFI